MITVQVKCISKVLQGFSVKTVAECELGAVYG